MPTATSLDHPMNFPAIPLVGKLVSLAEKVPMSLIQLAARVAVAHVFWNSAQSKLASWEVTKQLFAMEYQVPLLSPDIAAPLATATELTGAVLLFFGFLTRLGALALLGITATIQFFVYPQNWGDHILWASLLLLLLTRGAGGFSLDHVLGRIFQPKH